MIEWFAIGILAIINILTSIVLIGVRNEQNKRLSNNDSDYVDVIKQQHEEYIQEVREELNHTHGVPLTHEDMVNSPLFYYTTQAMINDMPVPKAAIAIVLVLDELIRRKQEEVDPRVQEIRDDAETARQLRTGKGD